MSDADNVIRGIWKKERPRSQDGGLGQDELRDRWMERYPNVCYSGGDWRVYEAGMWRTVEPEVIEAQIIDVLEGSRAEGVKVTAALMKNIMALARSRVYVPVEVWDQKEDVLVCRNGTLDLESRNLREHRPGDYATSGVPYDYDPEADCEVFLAVLRSQIPDSEKFLQEFAGYCLTTSTELETALWLTGPRGCGKSTIIEGFVAMLGPRHSVLGLGEIETSTFALSKIPGKTLLTATEQPAGFVKSAHVLNTLISGEVLRVERKYRDAVEISPVAKIIWSMNELPRIGSTTSGIFRRVKVLEFPPLRRRRMPELKQLVRQEGAGILNWALEGLARLRERGEFSVPESVASATEEFRLSNDIPAQFVDERCDTGAGYEVPAQRLYQEYAEWAREYGYSPMGAARIAEEWKRLGFEPRKAAKGQRIWRGVRLRGDVL